MCTDPIQGLLSSVGLPRPPTRGRFLGGVLQTGWLSRSIAVFLSFASRVSRPSPPSPTTLAPTEHTTSDRSPGLRLMLIGHPQGVPLPYPKAILPLPPESLCWVSLTCSLHSSTIDLLMSEQVD